MRFVKTISWGFILLLLSLLMIDVCRGPVYIIPASITCTYILFNMYPWLAKRMHQRKLTYEDLAVIAEDELTRKQYQFVFTRCQQIGGSLCAGGLMAYALHQYHSYTNIYETLGILGGLLSLYVRVFNHIGAFCISCLYKMKGQGDYFNHDFQRHNQKNNDILPSLPSPQNTEKCEEIL